MSLPCAIAAPIFDDEDTFTTPVESEEDFDDSEVSRDEQQYLSEEDAKKFIKGLSRDYEHDSKTSRPSNVGSSECNTNTSTRYYSTSTNNCESCVTLCNKLTHSCLTSCQGYLAHDVLPQLFSSETDTELTFPGCLARVGTQLQQENIIRSKEGFFNRPTPLYLPFKTPTFWHTQASDVIRPYLTEMSQSEAQWLSFKDIAYKDYLNHISSFPNQNMMENYSNKDGRFAVKKRYIQDQEDRKYSDPNFPLNTKSPLALYSLAEYVCANTLSLSDTHSYLQPFSRGGIVFFVPDESNDVNNCVTDTKESMAQTVSGFSGRSAKKELKRLHGSSEQLTAEIQLACQDLISSQPPQASQFRACSDLVNYKLVGTMYTVDNSASTPFTDKQTAIINDLQFNSENLYTGRLLMSHSSEEDKEKIRSYLLHTDSANAVRKVLHNANSNTNRTEQDDNESPLLSSSGDISILCTDQNGGAPNLTLTLTGNGKKAETQIFLNANSHSNSVDASSTGNHDMIYQFTIQGENPVDSLRISTRPVLLSND